VADFQTFLMEKPDLTFPSCKKPNRDVGNNDDTLRCHERWFQS